MTRYLTIAEAAEILRIDKRTLANKISAGVFKEGVHYFRPPGMHVRFKAAALEAWIEGRDDTARSVSPRIRMAGGYVLGSGR